MSALAAVLLLLPLVPPLQAEIRSFSKAPDGSAVVSEHQTVASADAKWDVYAMFAYHPVITMNVCSTGPHRHLALLLQRAHCLSPWGGTG